MLDDAMTTKWYPWSRSCKTFDVVYTCLCFAAVAAAACVVTRPPEPRMHYLFRSENDRKYTARFAVIVINTFSFWLQLPSCRTLGRMWGREQQRTAEDYVFVMSENAPALRFAQRGAAVSSERRLIFALQVHHAYMLVLATASITQSVKP